MSEEDGSESLIEGSGRPSGPPSQPLHGESLPSAEAPVSEEREESTEMPDLQDQDDPVGDHVEIEEDFDSDWEEEDIQLFRELREYSGLMTSQINTSSVTSTSLTEDPANLQARVRKLQEDVMEWKRLYDELMEDFRNLKLKAVVEKEELFKEVKAQKNRSRDSKENACKLQSELQENRTLLQLAESRNRYLLKQVNGLRKERGMREVELEQVSDQVSSLNKDSMLGRMVEDDLNDILSVLEDGVESGVVKFSKLMLKSQVPSFTLKDLPIGPCTCGPLLECYKEDLEKAREELKERAVILESTAKDLSSRAKEHETTLNQLAESEECLMDANRERDQFQEKVNESEDRLERLAEDLGASKQENETLKEELTQAESRCMQLEEASSKALSEVNSLSEEVEELRSKEGVAIELRRHVREVEAELELKQTEISNCEDRLKVVSEEVWYSEQENEAMHSRLVETEAQRDELKSTSEDRLLEVDSLSHEVEELREKEDLMDDLHRNMEEVEMELNRKQGEICNYEERLKRMSEDIWLSEQENESLHDQLVHVEDHCREVEMTSADRLSEVNSLAEEVAELRVRENLLDSLKKHIEVVEVELEVKQREISNYEDKLEKVSGDVLLAREEKEGMEVQLVKSERHRTVLEVVNSEKMADIGSLSREVEELKARERLAASLRTHIQELEIDMAAKHRDISDYEDRLRRLVEDVEGSKQENRSLQDQLVRVERRRSVLELTNADRLSEICSLSREVEELRMKDDQVDKMRQRVHELEIEMRQKDREMEGTKEKMVEVEYSHADIIEQLSSFERGHDEDSLRVMEEKDSEITMLREQCIILEESLGSHLLMSSGERTNSEEDVEEAHIHQINRELESDLISLKTAYSDLEMKSEMLSQANTDLRQHLGDGGRSVSRDQLGLLNLGPSSLSLSVNVDINNLQPSCGTTTLTTGTNTVGVATATIPLRFDSNYRRTMENGLLSAPALDENHYGGSETESEAAYLDKDYWVQRAGELSLQLQQSSGYWSSKVRELAIELEKERQLHRSVKEQRRVDGTSGDQEDGNQTPEEPIQPPGGTTEGN